MSRLPHRIALGALVLGALACGAPEPPSEPRAREAVGPTEATREILRRARTELPLDDPRDFEDAERGRIAPGEAIRLRTAAGDRVFDARAYGFVEGEAPETVHPSLWRQARLNQVRGLFRVVPGVYQVRGYDLSAMTVIAGRSGWIVVDPLTAAETAQAAMALVEQHLGPRPVTAVVFTHSHVDHFGGVLAILPAEEQKARGVPVVAPAGFLEEATRENVLAGTVMARRATYMFGMALERGPRGHVDSGLGIEPATGSPGILPPTVTIDHTPQELELDGVRFVFQYAPETEAPAELSFYLPASRALCTAELVTHTLHNLYTLRGAKVRDALRWSRAIDEMIALFPDAEVAFASHHWPVFGRERVLEYLEQHRDTYRYIHDQTLRLAARGLTPSEIAEQLELPASLRRGFSNRDYYGTVKHNARAVYQAYFGWFDGNPAHLDPLPPEEEGRRWVELLGGSEAVLEHARERFRAGDHRFAATLLNHLVFADPENTAARELLARTYEELGYRAESGPWRDVYLTGARELREGPTPSRARLASARDLLRHIPLDQLFDALATRVDGPAADGRHLRVALSFTDAGVTWVLELKNAVLHPRRAPTGAVPEADATVRITRDLFLRLLSRQAGLRELLFSDELDVEGSRTALLELFRLLEEPDGAFAIVTP